VELDIFTRETVNKARDWIERSRGLPPGSVDFYLTFDRQEGYTAKFDYGMAGRGSLHIAIFTAIGRALEAIEGDVLDRL